MSALENEISVEIVQKQFDQSLQQFDIRKFTQAPLRMRGSFQFNRNVDDVFAKVTDPQLIASWFGMVKGGSVDHSNSCNAGQWGAGSKRYCNTSMGLLDESIYHWDAPYLCAYNVKSWSMPIKDHCAVMMIKPLTHDTCELTWLQYFNYKGLVMRHFFPKMMLKMMNGGLADLAEEFGGMGGKMELLKLNAQGDQ